MNLTDITKTEIKSMSTGHWWLTLGILATWKSVIRRIKVGSQPRQKKKKKKKSL
jgi:hypothetical protein